MPGILIVDDNTDILEVMELLLSTRGFTVRTITRCEETLEKIKSFKPDVILLDVSLEYGIDVRNICKKLKEDKNLKHIPIILFSALTGFEYYSQYCKADDFIQKPFDVLELISVINKHLKPVSFVRPNATIQEQINNQFPITVVN